MFDEYKRQATLSTPHKGTLECNTTIDCRPSRLFYIKGNALCNGKSDGAVYVLV